MDRLNEFSKLIPLRVNSDVKIKKDSMKIRIVKKYLLISSKLNCVFEKSNLFIKTFFGLLNDKI
tara:strand:+ start:239 stop:430 length:192 start_codon:yes stop_codon:yes gene_type:complete